MESPQLQSIVVVDIPVMAHRQIPMVIEILQLQYIDMVVDVGCAGVVACPLCATTAAHDRCPHAVHRHWVDVAVVSQRQVPAVGLDSWDEG